MNSVILQLPLFLQLCGYQMPFLIWPEEGDGKSFFQMEIPTRVTYPSEFPKDSYYNMELP